VSLQLEKVSVTMIARHIRNAKIKWVSQMSVVR